MPITEFSSFSDGLEPHQRGRGNFIANVEVDNERLWIPYVENVWVQPCSFDLSAGTYSVVLKDARRVARRPLPCGSGLWLYDRR